MQEYAHLRLRRSMDRTKVSGTFDVGSIPSGANAGPTAQKRSGFSCSYRPTLLSAL